MSGAGYHEPPPRGVWVLPFRDAAGRELAGAFTSDGRLLALMPMVGDPLTVGAVESALLELLDHEDPPRRTAGPDLHILC